MKRLENGSFILFGGNADIEEDNIRDLLNQNLPEDMGACIQAEIPARGYRGLKRVRAWLEEQFKEHEIARTASMTAYIEDLNDADVKDTYLVVLWDADNRETEELVSAAQARGIMVLDLTAGMDELQLTSKKKDEPQEPEPAQTGTGRRSRRAAARTAEENPRPAIAAVPDTSETAPWEPGSTQDDTQPAAAAAAHALGQALGQAVGQAVEAAAAEFVRKFVTAAEEQAPDRPEGTKPWLQNPKAPDELKARGRGRPRDETASWNLIYLTPDQEKALGLSAG